MIRWRLLIAYLIGMIAVGLPMHSDRLSPVIRLVAMLFAISFARDDGRAYACGPARRERKGGTAVRFLNWIRLKWYESRLWNRGICSVHFTPLSTEFTGLSDYDGGWNTYCEQCRQIEQETIKLCREFEDEHIVRRIAELRAAQQTREGSEPGE